MCGWKWPITGPLAPWEYSASFRTLAWEGEGKERGRRIGIPVPINSFLIPLSSEQKFACFFKKGQLQLRHFTRLFQFCFVNEGSNMVEVQCSIGRFLSDECFKSSFLKGIKKQFERTLFKDIDQITRRLISLRVYQKLGNLFSELDDICGHHYAAYHTFYTNGMRKCCDPLKKHKKRVPGTREISLQLHDDVSEKFSLFIIPGQTLCQNCHNYLLNSKANRGSRESSPDEEIIMLTKCDELSPFKSPIKPIDRVNDLLKPMYINPLPQCIVKQNRKRRLEYASEISEQVSKRIKQELETALGLQDDGDQLTNSLHLNDYSSLLKELKEKCSQTSSHKKKVSILTLAPRSWSQRQVADYFEVPLYTVRQSRQLKEEKGILCELKPKKGAGISEEDAQEIKDVYNSDEYTRMMPGQKDYVLVSYFKSTCNILN
jgi:hypothetical protein